MLLEILTNSYIRILSFAICYRKERTLPDNFIAPVIFFSSMRRDRNRNFIIPSNGNRTDTVIFGIYAAIFDRNTSSDRFGTTWQPHISR